MPNCPYLSNKSKGVNTVNKKSKLKLIRNVDMKVLSGLGLDRGQAREVRRAAEEAARGAATGRYLALGRNQRRTRKRKRKRRTRTEPTSVRRTTVGSVTLTLLSLTRKVNRAVRK